MADRLVALDGRNMTAGAVLRAGNLDPPSERLRRTRRWRRTPSGKIVLLQPRVGYMDSMRSKPALPLSLLHAASLVVAKHDVVVIDQRTASDWRERLVRELQAGPLLVGITCYTGPMIRRALEMASIVRE